MDKFLGVSRIPNGIHRRLDLVVVTESSRAGATVYFTGSEIFNRRLRTYGGCDADADDASAVGFGE